MTLRRYTVEGEVWVAVDDVARCYRVEISEIQVWISEGFLQPPREVEGTAALSSLALEQIARLYHLTRLIGLDLPVLRFLAETGELPREAPPGRPASER